jgi:hypothetical protein
MVPRSFSFARRSCDPPLLRFTHEKAVNTDEEKISLDGGSGLQATLWGVCPTFI